MKVLHINYYDSSSGSGVAAFRLHKALQYAGVESEMLVMQKENQDHSVKKASFFCRAHAWIYQRLAARILRLQKSLNHFPNPVLRAIYKSDADVVHLHWIGGEMLSAQMHGRINSWAIRWYASAFLQDKLTLYSGKNLVEHIGYTGTHVREKAPDVNYELSDRFPGVSLVEDPQVDKEMFHVISAFWNKTRRSWKQRVKRWIRKIVPESFFLWYLTLWRIYGER